MRELLQRGLGSIEKMTDGDGRKSSEFGVFSRGGSGHLDGKEQEGE